MEADFASQGFAAASDMLENHLVGPLANERAETVDQSTQCTDHFLDFGNICIVVEVVGLRGRVWCPFESIHSVVEQFDLESQTNSIQGIWPRCTFGVYESVDEGSTLIQEP